MPSMVPLGLQQFQEAVSQSYRLPQMGMQIGQAIKQNREDRERRRGLQVSGEQLSTMIEGLDIDDTTRQALLAQASGVSAGLVRSDSVWGAVTDIAERQYIEAEIGQQRAVWSESVFNEASLVLGNGRAGMYRDAVANGSMTPQQARQYIEDETRGPSNNNVSRAEFDSIVNSRLGDWEREMEAGGRVVTEEQRRDRRTLIEVETRQSNPIYEPPVQIESPFDTGPVQQIPESMKLPAEVVPPVQPELVRGAEQIANLTAEDPDANLAASKVGEGADAGKKAVEQKNQMFAEKQREASERIAELVNLQSEQDAIRSGMEQEDRRRRSGDITSTEYRKAMMDLTRKLRKINERIKHIEQPSTKPKERVPLGEGKRWPY